MWVPGLGQWRRSDVTTVALTQSIAHEAAAIVTWWRISRVPNRSLCCGEISENKAQCVNGRRVRRQVTNTIGACRPLNAASECKTVEFKMTMKTSWQRGNDATCNWQQSWNDKPSLCLRDSSYCISALLPFVLNAISRMPRRNAAYCAKRLEIWKLVHRKTIFEFVTAC